jgi:hypothetical protein
VLLATSCSVEALNVLLVLIGTIYHPIIVIEFNVVVCVCAYIYIYLCPLTILFSEVSNGILPCSLLVLDKMSQRSVFRRLH